MIPVKPRYLPGQVDSRTQKTDFEIFKNHRINVTFAKPKIDNNSPKLNIALIYNKKQFKENLIKVTNIDKENMELLYNINYIHIIGGKVDCWNKFDSSMSTPRYMNAAIDRLERVIQENKKIARRISRAKSNYSLPMLMKEWHKNKQKIIEKSKYPLWTEDPRFMAKTFSIGKVLSVTDSKNVNRTKCFFEIELVEEKQYLGKLIFELYSDYVPKTCANFEAICRGYNGLSYKGTPIHRIVTDYWCQGGDVTKFDGSGGTSIYGDSFEDENFNLNHTDIGILSMWSNGPNTNNSKFNITFKRLETMDKRRVVFGRLIKGLEHLLEIQYFGTKYGKPRKKIIISNCGVLEEN